MSLSVHNPDQYMASLRQIIAQGRKRIGLLVGAGAPAGILAPGTDMPLIPAVAGLTEMVLKALPTDYGKTLNAVCSEFENPNIENILSRVRSSAGVIGKTPVHGLDGAGHETLSKAICTEMGKIVNRPLPEGQSPYTEFVTWISGTDREQPIEIFTTNYDLLFEQAHERAKVPCFDGFTGVSASFFDPSSVAGNDLPSRWTRIWKLHGSLGWTRNDRGEIIRTGRPDASELVFPDHLKYDQTQKAPYAALFDRLRAFLMTPDSGVERSNHAHGTARRRKFSALGVNVLGKGKSMKTAIQAELPAELLAEARAFVEQGSVGDFDELLAEALRRYLESHSTRLAESFIREDLAWGLRGRE
ncbi:MAG: SIR2 family protein [Candidatus Binatia bacterium]